MAESIDNTAATGAYGNGGSTVEECQDMIMRSFRSMCVL